MTRRLTARTLLTRPLLLAGMVAVVAACERQPDGSLYIAEVNGPEHAISPSTAHPLLVESKGGQLSLRLPDCRDFSKPTSYNFRNTVYSDWGCAHQRNLGVMVANPADIAGAAALETRDPERTDKVIRDYRDGKATLSEYGGLGAAPGDRGGF